jgi:hypothetical protein
MDYSPNLREQAAQIPTSSAWCSTCEKP